VKRINKAGCGLLLTTAGVVTELVVVPGIWGQGSSTAFELAVVLFIAGAAAIVVGLISLWEAIKP